MSVSLTVTGIIVCICNGGSQDSYDGCSGPEIAVTVAMMMTAAMVMTAVMVVTAAAVMPAATMMTSAVAMR